MKNNSLVCKTASVISVAITHTLKLQCYKIQIVNIILMYFNYVEVVF